jgi:hypothetical protein
MTQRQKGATHSRRLKRYLDRIALLGNDREAKAGRGSRRDFKSEFLHMSDAIERIVSAYVKLRDSKTLEEMKAHRHRLVTELKSLTGTLDVSSSIKLFEDDIAVIDAGLAELRPAAAAEIDGADGGSRHQSRPLEHHVRSPAQSSGAPAFNGGSWRKLR